MVTRAMNAWLLVQVLLAVVVGTAVGLGGYTFVYARGYSYLSDDPSACANCHVMNTQYARWQRSAHARVATCNDCHTPSGTLAKYWVKAQNGFYHSLAFTTGRFHEPIRAREPNRLVAQQSCQKCHAELTSALASHGEGVDEALPACVRCHGAVGHPL